MCKLYSILYLLFNTNTLIYTFAYNLNSNCTSLVNKPINYDDAIKFPASLSYQPKNVFTLPTTEDNLFHKIPDLSADELESEKKLEEINESIKNGAIEDPITKEKLFQNEEDDQPELEVKDPSLGKSGKNYQKGVESTAEDMNDISNKLESDGTDQNLDDIQLRDNLLDQIMKSQHQYNFGA